MKKINFRQFGSLFIIISLSSLFKNMPKLLIKNDNLFFDILSLIIINSVIIGAFSVILKYYKGLNIYEILKKLFGTILSKFIIFIIGVGFLYLIYIRLKSYLATINTLLMPNTSIYILLFTIIILLLYALSKKERTIFILADFLLVPIILIILLFLAFSISNIDLNNFYSLISIKPLNYELFFLESSLLLLVFINDKLKSFDNPYIELFKYHGIFIFLLLIISFICIGICGPYIAAKTNFAFYLASKSIMFFSFFGRLEVVIILISVISDYMALYFYSLLFFYCMKWTFLSYDKM